MSYRPAALIALSLFIGAGSVGCPAADEQAAPDERASPQPKLAQIAAASLPAGAPEPAAEPAEPAAGVIEAAYAGTTPPESVQMLLAILGGQQDPGAGWYGPGASRHSWKSLAAMHGVSGYDPITADEFRGTETWFERLDRDGDARISVSDLDWSDGNDWVRRTTLVDPGPMPLTQADIPTQPTMIRALFAGDFGSLNEGPAVDERAPDFSLKTHDEAATVRLADLLAEGKPVVLTFGNFTCGPFRHTFPRRRGGPRAVRR